MTCERSLLFSARFVVPACVVTCFYDPHRFINHYLSVFECRKMLRLKMEQPAYFRTSRTIMVFRIFQIHRVLQRIVVGLPENQPVTTVPDSPDSSRRAALRTDGLSGFPQSVRGPHSGLHFRSVFRDECARIHR